MYCSTARFKFKLNCYGNLSHIRNLFFMYNITYFKAFYYLFYGIYFIKGSYVYCVNVRVNDMSLIVFIKFFGNLQ